MTAVIAGNFGTYALLLADTRTSNALANGWEDGDQKIFRTHFGLVAGAGTRGMIHAVVGKVNQHLLQPQHLPEMMHRYQQQARRDVADIQAAHIYSLEWSYMVATSIEEAPSGLAVAHVLVSTPLGGGDFERDDLAIRGVRILGPTRDAALTRLEARCRHSMQMPNTARLDRTQQPANLVANVTANVQLAIEALNEIASTNPSVSATFMVAIQYSPTDVRVWGPNNNPPDPTWSA